MVSPHLCVSVRSSWQQVLLLARLDFKLAFLFVDVDFVTLIPADVNEMVSDVKLVEASQQQGGFQHLMCSVCVSLFIIYLPTPGLLLSLCVRVFDR